MRLVLTEPVSFASAQVAVPVHVVGLTLDSASSLADGSPSAGECVGENRRRAVSPA